MKLAIFDMDGTLIDSQHDITESINHVRKEYYGLSEALTCSYVVEAINRDQRNLAELFYGTREYESGAKALFEAHYHHQCIQNPTLYEGIAETLEALRSDDIKISVATNAYAPFASRMIAHLGVDHHFDRIIGSDMVSSPKPAPDMLHLIFDHYGFDPKRHSAWMIGDNSKDMKVAKAAGITSIFAAWGFASEGEGDHIAHHPSHLLDIIR